MEVYKMKKTTKSFRLDSFTIAYLTDYAEFMELSLTEALENMVAQYHREALGFIRHTEIMEKVIENGGNNVKR